MPQFGTKSRAKRDQCTVKSQGVLNEAIKHVDFSVVTGHRDMATQNEAHANGRSQLQWPNSRHNSLPAEAFDIIPYPSGWDATWEEWYELATYILVAAAEQGVPLEWGGHWKNFTGQGDKDRDWAHFEERK